MNFYSQNLYKQLEENLINAVKKNSNLLIVTLPGLGVSYFLKKLIQKKIDNRILYINGENERLATYNILDLNFEKKETALTLADKYFKLANLKQKFALVISTPQILDTEQYKNSYLSSHIYKTYYFKAREERDTEIFAKEINIGLKKEKLSRIYKLTGGIGTLVKFFAINEEKINESSTELIEDQDLTKIIEPISATIANCKKDVLMNLNILKDEHFLSELLSTYFEKYPVKEMPNLILNPDLSFSEDGVTNPNRLTKSEYQIALFMLQNDGTISKEKIADYKWGNESYDTYSDQAVGKTMQRLRKKMSRYDVEVLPRVGYKLIKRR